MIVSVDDSGDPGLKLERGSIAYFVIAAIIFKDDLDAEETALKIKRLRQKLNWKPKHEFKFRKTSPEIRKLFLTELKSCNFVISLVIIDKATLEDDKVFKKDASKFYNATILKAIKSFELERAHILIDGEGGSTYRRHVKTFFRQSLTKGAMEQLTYRDSVDNNLIQLADMIAGAAHRLVGRDKDSSYIRIVNKHIVGIKTDL